MEKDIFKTNEAGESDSTSLGPVSEMAVRFSDAVASALGTFSQEVTKSSNGPAGAPGAFVLGALAGNAKFFEALYEGTANAFQRFGNRTSLSQKDIELLAKLTAIEMLRMQTLADAAKAANEAAEPTVIT